MTGYPDGKPARAGTSVADMAAASNAVIAILAALRSRDRDGQGEYITIPIFESTVSLMGYWLTYLDLYEQAPQRRGASHSLYAPYDIFETSDDEYVFIAATNDDHWRTVKRVFDLSLGFDDRDARLANRAEIDAAIKQATRQRGRDDIVDDLLAEGVPCAPVNDIEDVAADPHLRSAGALTHIESLDHPERSVATPLFPIQTETYSIESDAPPPRLGADVDEVLAEWIGTDIPTETGR